MALLESCYCCNLLIASVLIGVYVLVAYVIAFTIELWWILETEVGLPAPAYLLCLGYFIVFVQTAFLLHGLSVKRSLFLKGWLFVIVIFSFPEAGLVLFMSLYHWQLDHLYGLTELTCWVIRLCINIAGLLIIQSLYSQWKEEIEVMQRLQALNMTSIIPQRVSHHSGNGHLSNGSSLIGHHNDGFVKSTNRLNGSLRRSHSVLSNGQPIGPQLYNPPLPLNNHPIYNVGIVPLNNAPPLYGPPDLANHSPSEFNASQFDAIASTFTNQIFNNLAAPAENTTNNIAKFNRTQSLLDLRTIKKISDINMDTYSLQGDPRSNLEHVRPNYTQSLDRRKYRKRGGSMGSVNELNDYNSLERMNVYTDSEGRYILQTGPSPRDYYRYQSFDGQQRRMRNAESGRSLAESDDLRKYQDVAL